MSTLPILLNRNIHGFLVTDRIGQGGMGEVYKATHQKSGQVVAIKILMHLKGVQRFRNEARLQANVNHPNIVKLFDIFDVEGRPALILEYIEGDDLDVYLQKNPKLSVQEKLRLFCELASAIEHIHTLNITHRDIKPSNIKVQKNGQIKLIDFGIAKGYSSPTVTMTGETIGTLDYMSPERLYGKYTSQSDVWSLGVILYELMYGNHPFKKSDEREMRKAIMKGEYHRPDKVQNVQGNEKQVAMIINRCLQTNPTRRYESAAQVVKSVERVMKYGTRMSMTNLIPKIKQGRLLKMIPFMLLGLVGICLFTWLISQLNGTDVRDGINPGPYSEPITRTIHSSTAGNVFVVLENGSRCPVPCELVRNKGEELTFRVEAEGYESKTEKIVFRKNEPHNVNLR